MPSGVTVDPRLLHRIVPSGVTGINLGSTVTPDGTIPFDPRLLHRIVPSVLLLIQDYYME